MLAQSYFFKHINFIKGSPTLFPRVYYSKEYPNFEFKVTNQNSTQRLGTIYTPHGNINTPAFIFCGTKAAMKAVTPSTLENEGTQIILSNTYHLMLSPGEDIIKKMGGLHKFSGWKGPMFTDSGGLN
jgi:queuine tRNA-ribosyltransferase